jgi:hypothetical protein
MTQWVTVYDFAGHWPKFGNMLFLLAFVAIGLFIHRKAKRDADETLVMPFGITKRQQGMWGGLVFASIAGLMSAVAIPGMLIDYAQTRSVYVHQQYKLVQGVVRDFDSSVLRSRESRLPFLTLMIRTMDIIMPLPMGELFGPACPFALPTSMMAVRTSS